VRACGRGVGRKPTKISIDVMGECARQIRPCDEHRVQLECGAADNDRVGAFRLLVRHPPVSYVGETESDECFQLSDADWGRAGSSSAGQVDDVHH
jgi:hypothetical protein